MFYFGDSMKKSFRHYAIFAAIGLSACAAYATGNHQQQVSSTLYNSGSINNTVNANATVNGPGSSFSAATGEAWSTTKATSMTEINPVCGGTCGAKSGAVQVTGEAQTGVTGTAFNVSTGNGTGSAGSVGNASAYIDAKAQYNGPGQEVKVYGNLGQDASMDVNATKNTGGYASSGNTGEFTVDGAVGSKVCTGENNCGGQIVNKEVWGSVKDTKTTTSYGNTGAMTVDGNVLTQAPVNANASSFVNAGGSYLDPQ